MEPPERTLWSRARARLGWECEKLRSRNLVPAADRLASNRGWLARRVRWPLPGCEPFRRAELHLARQTQVGDLLLCTPALRRLKQVNPACRVTFYTDLPALLEGLPFVDEVRPMKEKPPWAIMLGYEGSVPPRSVPPRRHLARILGDQLGLDVRDVRPSCLVDPGLRDGFTESWRGLPRPWVVVNRHASDWTPNKLWPAELWEELIDRLLGWATVVEIGQVPPPGRDVGSSPYVNLVGRTTVPGLIAAMAAADLHVGPISGPVHVAAAVGRPSVVIYGGYEDPSCSSYPGNIDLGTDVPCAPCWLRDPCPYDRKCLRQIRPSAVERSIETLWRDAPGRVSPGQPVTPRGAFTVGGEGPRR